MTDEQLLWLHQIPEYVYLYERMVNESNTLTEMLEAIGWKPNTSGQHQQVASQGAIVRDVKRQLTELRERLIDRFPNAG